MSLKSITLLTTGVQYVKLLFQTQSPRRVFISSSVSLILGEKVDFFPPLLFFCVTTPIDRVCVSVAAVIDRRSGLG